MEKILFFPYYLEKNLKSKVKDLGKEKGYLVNFYPLNSLLGKISRAYDLYDLEKIIAVGQKKEYRFDSLVDTNCGFNHNKIFPVLLKSEDIRNHKRALDKILKEL